MRLGLAGDLASGEANTSSRGLHFINADYTVYLGRELQGEYIGLQPYGHVSERGVAVGQCIVHDQQGPVGFIATTALAKPEALPPHPLLRSGRPQPRRSMASSRSLPRGWRE